VERALDLPVAEFGPEGRRQRRYFAQLAGAGLDARAVELVDWRLKKKVGPLAYVVAALRAMQGPQVPITVKVPLETVTGELVLLGNGRFYGGKFVLFPNADPGDGRLDVCVFPKVNWRTVLGCSMGLPSGRVYRCRGACHLQAESVTLTSAARVPLQVDGETVGELPATFSIRPKRLRVLVP
jgi:diacylglycerol kinase (ATP)